MSINNFPESWYLFAQALGDGMGYPKSEKAQKQLGFTMQELKKLHDEIVQKPNKEFTETEKQMILNCIDGALDYVGSDIPSLYDISQAELEDFKKKFEKRWAMNSIYRSNKGGGLK